MSDKVQYISNPRFTDRRAKDENEMEDSTEYGWKKNFCAVDRIIGYILVLILLNYVILTEREKMNTFINILVIFGILFFFGFEIILMRYEFIFHKGMNISIKSDKGLSSTESIHLIINKIMNQNSRKANVTLFDRPFFEKNG